MSELFKIVFQKTLFAMGCPRYDQLPEDEVVEIAIAGRSNAGKSTLINNITSQNKLARVSASPGKTREINLFSLFDNQNRQSIARLVDLPGYGYAKVGKQLRISWQTELTEYLTQRDNIKILLVVLDSRMPPTELDLRLIQMASMRNLQQIFIFNKVDKLGQSEKAKLKTIAQSLSYNTPNSTYVYYASPKKIGKEELSNLLSNEIIKYLQEEKPS
jgi:GTP-binding protein